MDNRTFYYARVSSKEQNLDRQLAAFAALGASERDIITDKESGKDLDRRGYNALKSALLRRGDTLVVKSLDRLSRNKADIKNELQYFHDNGIRLKVLDLPTTMMDCPAGQEWVWDMVNNILIEVLGTIAQQERETIRSRQAEGIAAAFTRRVLQIGMALPSSWKTSNDGRHTLRTINNRNTAKSPGHWPGDSCGAVYRTVLQERVISSGNTVFQ